MFPLQFCDELSSVATDGIAKLSRSMIDLLRRMTGCNQKAQHGRGVV